MWVRELARRAGTGAGAVQRELAFLREIGLVVMRREGGAAFYEVVWTHQLAGPLRQLVELAGATAARPSPAVESHEGAAS